MRGHIRGRIPLVLSLVAVTAVTAVGVVRAQTPAPASCDVDAGTLGPATAAAHGAGLAAAVPGAIVVFGDGNPEAFAPADHGGVLRHVASANGQGTAFVRDLPGPDQIVIATPGGVETLTQDTEVTHPAWSPAGDLVWATGSGIRLRDRSGLVTDVPGPAAGGLVFSPAFATPTAVVAVVSAPPTLAVPEGNALDDLWRYDLTTRAWTKLTAFTADQDRWSVIRTPIVATPGVVEFVRISGRASQTGPATYELWSLRGRSAAKVRTLPGEMYLAGIQAGRHVWNVRESESGRWRLLREEAGGAFTDLGCGAVMVDPLEQTDPDRVAVEDQNADLPTTSRATDPHLTGFPFGILVGDFATEAGARDAAATIAAAYGPDTTIEVITSNEEPTVVAPGVWAVILGVPAGTDPGLALAAFRTRLPRYDGWSWMVTP